MGVNISSTISTLAFRIAPNFVGDKPPPVEIVELITVKSIPCQSNYFFRFSIAFDNGLIRQRQCFRVERYAAMLIIIHTILADMTAEAKTSIPKVRFKGNEKVGHIHSSVIF